MVSGSAEGHARSTHGTELERNGRTSLRRKLSAWIPVIFCMLVIAVESTPYLGADHTTGPLRQLAESLFGPIPELEWANIHHYIRKCGHFIGYGSLSLAWFRAFWMTYQPFQSLGRRRLAAHLLAIGGTFAVACSDEFHQTFLPNRTGTFHDVLVDCFGACTMQIALLFLMQWRLAR